MMKEVIMHIMVCECDKSSAVEMYRLCYKFVDVLIIYSISIYMLQLPNISSALFFCT